MTSLELDYLCEDPFSKGGHILGDWDSGFDISFFVFFRVVVGEHTLIPSSNGSSFFYKFSKERNSVLHFCSRKSLPRKMLSSQRFCSSNMCRCKNIKLLSWSSLSINLKARNLLCLEREGFFPAELCQECGTNCLFPEKYSLLSTETGKNQTPFSLGRQPCPPLGLDFKRSLKSILAPAIKTNVPVFPDVWDVPGNTSNVGVLL